MIKVSDKTHENVYEACLKQELKRMRMQMKAMGYMLWDEYEIRLFLDYKRA